MEQATQDTGRTSLYAEVTARVIGELEQGRLPWVQPWDGAACGCMMPQNGLTKRSYSGINVLILWAAVIEGGYSSQRWLTFRQALQLGGHVRKGEKEPSSATPTASPRRARRSGRGTRIATRGRSLS
jgi:antirestriction protein ArdC